MRTIRHHCNWSDNGDAGSRTGFVRWRGDRHDFDGGSRSEQRQERDDSCCNNRCIDHWNADRIGERIIGDQA